MRGEGSSPDALQLQTLVSSGGRSPVGVLPSELRTFGFVTCGVCDANVGQRRCDNQRCLTSKGSVGVTTNGASLARTPARAAPTVRGQRVSVNRVENYGSH